MADGFNPKSYLDQEADEIASQFLTLRKQDLMDLGLHLELSVKATMRKTMLQEIVLDYLESEEIVPEGSVEISMKGSRADSALEIRRLELEFEAKKLEQEQEAKRLEQEKKIAAELEAKRLDLEERKLAAEEQARKDKILAEEQARKDRLEFEREMELAKLQ